METIKNVMQLFVAKDITANANEGSVATTSTVADGEVVVVAANGADGTSSALEILDAASLPTGLNAFKLVANVGGTLVQSDVVEQGSVAKWHVTGTAEEAQQVDYVGYNGTSGEIETLAANTIYTIRLSVLGVTKADFMQQLIKEGFYKSGSSTPTQAQIALGLQKSLVANFSREPEQLIAFERVVSDASEAFGDSVGSLNFVKGSKYFTATDIDDATTNAAIAVGDYIRIGTALTDPVYAVTAINTTTNTGTLDTEFQGATQTLVSDTACGIIRTVVGDFGIKLSGQDLNFKAGYFKSNVVAWNTQIDFDSLVTNSVAAYPGIGTYQQVASLEKELQADHYVYRLFNEAGVEDNVQAVSTSAYDMGLLEYNGKIMTGGGTYEVNSPKQIMIAFEDDTPQGDDANVGVATTIDAILTAWGTTYNEDANLTA